MSDPSALLAPIRARVAAATEGPWFLSDCEGEVIILPEADLTSAWRNADGVSDSYGLPTSYRPERRILEVELDSWDEGEDEQDDQVRSNAAFIAAARTDIPRLLAALDAVLALADAYESEANHYEAQADRFVEGEVRSRYKSMAEDEREYAYAIRAAVTAALGEQA